MHTKGKWIVEPFTYGGTGTNLAHHTKFSVICGENYICTLSEGTEEKREANARLISAAPDLLKACKEISRAIKNQMKMEVDVLVNAIAKAEK